MELIIDNREIGLIDLFKSVNPETKFEVVQLPVGDIIINKSPYQLLIERKTVADLLSSINDGRYREQKSRIGAHIKELGSREPVVICRAIYIVEGIFDTTGPAFGRSTREQERSVFTGALISTQLRDGVSVFSTADLDDTRYLILRLFARMQKDAKELFPEIVGSSSGIGSIGGSNGSDNGSNSYLANVKVKKSDNLSPTSWNILALTNISGVSSNIAECIIKVHSSIRKLMDVYNNLVGSGDIGGAEKLLADISIGARKIGPVISKRVFNYLYGDI